jgi:hypothetical protein
MTTLLDTVSLDRRNDWQAQCPNTRCRSCYFVISGHLHNTAALSNAVKEVGLDVRWDARISPPRVQQNIVT